MHTRTPTPTHTHILRYRQVNNSGCQIHIFKYLIKLIPQRNKSVVHFTPELFLQQLPHLRRQWEAITLPFLITHLIQANLLECIAFAWFTNSSSVTECTANSFSNKAFPMKDARRGLRPVPNSLLQFLFQSTLPPLQLYRQNTLSSEKLKLQTTCVTRAGPSYVVFIENNAKRNSSYCHASNGMCAIITASSNPDLL